MKITNEQRSWLKSQLQALMFDGKMNRQYAEYQLYTAAHDGRLKYPDGTAVCVDHVDAISKGGER